MRWLRWTVFCLRGRRCADLVVKNFESDDVPPGSVLYVGFECARCGTIYESAYLVGNDNALIPTGRERLTLERLLERRRGVTVVDAGFSDDL